MNTAYKKYKVFSIAASRKILRSLLLTLFCFGAAFAQKKNNNAATLITQVPFVTFTGGVVVIRAQLLGYPDTLNFIMDTGSGGISLDSTTCIRLHITPELTDKLIMGIGGIRQLRYVNNRSLKVGGMQIDSLNFHVSDYDILSSVYGDRIDGIIGFSFLSRYIVKIDYDSNQMYVYSKGNFKYPKGGYAFKPSIVSLPVESATLRDSKEITPRFYFDTGAGLCLLLNADFIRDSSLLYSDRKPLPTQAQGMGGKANMQVTVLKEFRLGPYKFRNVPIHIFDDEFNITSYPYLAGLIGNDVLRRFNIILNYDKKTFYLTPNSHFRDQFDYSYTGVGLYWIDGEIRVGDVMKDSPADKAGIKVDDVVISINDNLSQNLQLYKSMLQNTGDRIKMLVNRKTVGLLELNMKVKTIF